MGREVYHGNPTGDSLHVELYDQGVREGALGLLLNSVRIVIITCILTALLFKFNHSPVIDFFFPGFGRLFLGSAHFSLNQCVSEWVHGLYGL